MSKLCFLGTSTYRKMKSTNSISPQNILKKKVTTYKNGELPGLNYTNAFPFLNKKTHIILGPGRDF